MGRGGGWRKRDALFLRDGKQTPRVVPLREQNTPGSFLMMWIFQGTTKKKAEENGGTVLVWGEEELQLPKVIGRI